MTKYDIESSFTEMRVAQNIHHPFIAGLRIAFQSQTKLFLGMHYYNGGDLFHHMSKGSSSRISPARARFYTAELILGIHHLHQHDILYRYNDTLIVYIHTCIYLYIYIYINIFMMAFLPE
jgi:serum/glucocorticoid-regulated kinase 2